MPEDCEESSLQDVVWEVLLDVEVAILNHSILAGVLPG